MSVGTPFIILMIVFVVTLLIGVPIAWSLAISCIASLVFGSGVPLSLIHI